MRVAIVSFAKGGTSPEILEALERGSRSAGAEGVVLDGFAAESPRLALYDYVAVVLRPASPFGGRVPARVREALSQAGTLVGKKGAAVVLKSPLGSGRLLRELMAEMERQGMKIDYFEAVAGAESALAAGKSLG